MALGSVLRTLLVFLIRIIGGKLGCALGQGEGEGGGGEGSRKRFAGEQVDEERFWRFEDLLPETVR